MNQYKLFSELPFAQSSNDVISPSNEPTITSTTDLNQSPQSPFPAQQEVISPPIELTTTAALDQSPQTSFHLQSSFPAQQEVIPFPNKPTTSTALDQSPQPSFTYSHPTLPSKKSSLILMSRPLQQPLTNHLSHAFISSSPAQKGVIPLLDLSKRSSAPDLSSQPAFPAQQQELIPPPNPLTSSPYLQADSISKITCLNKLLLMVNSWDKAIFFKMMRRKEECSVPIKNDEEFHDFTHLYNKLVPLQTFDNLLFLRS